MLAKLTMVNVEIADHSVESTALEPRCQAQQSSANIQQYRRLCFGRTLGVLVAKAARNRVRDTLKPDLDNASEGKHSGQLPALFPVFLRFLSLSQGAS
jgi:hypothetical protein